MQAPRGTTDDNELTGATVAEPTSLSGRNGRRGAQRGARPDPEATTTEAIPDIVVRRLPVYVRTLRGLAEQGIGSVSSDELADHIGVTAAQIRRDLSYFGRFGKQGK